MPGMDQADIGERGRGHGVSSLHGSGQIEVDELLEHRGLGRLQMTVMAICIMAAFVDGADRQGIGLVTVNLMSDLRIGATNMGYVFSLDNLGAVIGAVICGQLSDRYGRKPIMILTLAVMAVATLFTAHAGSYAGLATARFAAGLGLGGAVPAFLTLASEYVSKRHRGTVAAVIFAGYPVGAAFGGLWTSYLLRHSTWHSVFYVGALLPALVMVATIVLLPESMQYLVRTPGKAARAAAIARSIAPGVSRDAVIVDTPERTRSKAGSLAALFAGGLALPTVILWGIYMSLFATVKVVVIWLPSILTTGGIAQSSVALILGIWNIGSVCGQLSGLKFIERFGSRASVVTALVMMTAGLGIIGVFNSDQPAVMAAIALAGFGVGVSTSGVISITATLYPTEQRGTGMGAGMASSRFGQVLSPILIGVLIDMAVGTSGILYVIASLPLVAAVLVVAFTAVRLGAPATARA